MFSLLFRIKNMTSLFLGASLSFLTSGTTGGTTGTTGLGFFSSSVDTLKTIITLLGAGIAVWGIINLMEGYGNDQPASKTQGVKQLISGAGIILIAQALIPLLTSLI